MTSAVDRTAPVIDYTATGWRSILEAMERYAQEKYGSGGEVAWTDYNPNNPGSLLFDVMAQTGEMLVYHLNAYAREQVVTTLLRELSFVNLAKSYDYELAPADQAVVEMQLTSDPGSLPYVLPNTFKVSNGDATDPVVFQPLAETVISETPQTVGFEEGSQVADELLGVSDGNQFQRFQLAVQSLIVGTLVVKVDAVSWSEADNYSSMKETAAEYLTEPAEGGYTIVKFGDGVNGKVPPNGVEIRATYKVGGGSRGQVGANTLVNILSPLSGLLSITNLAAATGGNDAQTVAQGQKLLPGSLSTLNRAIAEGDYATLALNVSGVAKAIEVEGDTATKEVLLPIAPAGGGTPSTTLKNLVVRYFRDVKPVTFRVVPIDPYYLNIQLNIDLFVKDTYRQSVVLNTVTQRLLELLSFDNMDFGTAVRRQVLYDELRDNVTGYEGVSYVNILGLTAAPLAREYYGATNTGDGAFEGITTSVTVQKRTFIVRVDQVTPYIRFRVTQQILGYSTSVSDLTLTDDKANFDQNEHVGKTLNPNLNQATSFAISANSASALTIASGNLQNIAVPGEEYGIEQEEAVLGKVLRTTVDVESLALQNRLYVADTSNFEVGDRVLIRNGTTSEVAVVSAVGSGTYLDLASPLTNTFAVASTVDYYWQSGDATFGFAMVNGSTSFVIDDTYFFDTYERLADIEPRSEDIPQLLDVNLTVRAVGGLTT